MKIIKWLLSPFKWIYNLCKKLKRRWIFAKAYQELKKAHDERLKERYVLKLDIVKWLKGYFGIDSKSKYIPKDYKNKEKVKIAVIERFGDDMKKLNLEFSDLFA